MHDFIFSLYFRGTERTDFALVLNEYSQYIYDACEICSVGATSLHVMTHGKNDCCITPWASERENPVHKSEHTALPTNMCAGMNAVTNATSSLEAFEVSLQGLAL